jgi:hypothetical protein
LKQLLVSLVALVGLAGVTHAQQPVALTAGGPGGNVEAPLQAIADEMAPGPMQVVGRTGGLYFSWTRTVNPNDPDLVPAPFAPTEGTYQDAKPLVKAKDGKTRQGIVYFVAPTESGWYSLRCATAGNAIDRPGVSGKYLGLRP